MNTKNSTNIVWIDTHRVTLAEFEADVSYPIEDLRQGRDCTTPVPAWSMYAGKPIDAEEETDKAFRALFWWSYVGCITVIAIASVAIKVFG